MTEADEIQAIRDKAKRQEIIDNIICPGNTALPKAARLAVMVLSRHDGPDERLAVSQLRNALEVKK